MKYLLTLILFIAVMSPLVASQQHKPTQSKKEMLGEIGFDKLRVENITIGKKPHEGEQTQDLLIDMRITLDLQTPSDADVMESTIDHLDLADVIKKTATEGNYDTVDVLGLDILKHVFQSFPVVEKASIKIHQKDDIPEALSGGITEISLTRKELHSLNSNRTLNKKIGFDQMLMHTIVGDLPLERENEQELFVDVRVTVDLKALHEKIIINPIELSEQFKDVANKGQYQLIETLAVKYIKQLYQEYPQIEEVYVRIMKPGTLPGYPFKNDAITEIRR